MSCKCCNADTEPIIEMVPVYNGGFVPEAMEVKHVGFADLCDGCMDHMEADNAVHMEYVEDDLPF
jgi:hypothetical protein